MWQAMKENWDIFTQLLLHTLAVKTWLDDTRIAAAENFELIQIYEAHSVENAVESGRWWSLLKNFFLVLKQNFKVLY